MTSFQPTKAHVNDIDDVEGFDPTLCATWELIAPGEPCPTCADNHDARVAVKRAELAFRGERSSFDLTR